MASEGRPPMALTIIERVANHVEVRAEGISDAGSTPAASTTHKNGTVCVKPPHFF